MLPLSVGSRKYYVAEYGGGEMIGAGGWSFERLGTMAIAPGLAYVRHFATHPNWAGRGVASEILSKCISEVISQGGDCMEAYSTLAALGFYQKHGFVIVAPIDVPLASGTMLPSMLMRLIVSITT